MELRGKVRGQYVCSLFWSGLLHIVVGAGFAQPGQAAPAGTVTEVFRRRTDRCDVLPE